MVIIHKEVKHEINHALINREVTVIL
jgi:hypothetical protein